MVKEMSLCVHFHEAAMASTEGSSGGSQPAAPVRTLAVRQDSGQHLQVGALAFSSRVHRLNTGNRNLVQSQQQAVVWGERDPMWIHIYLKH
jgi:hypothetical protein